jgi:hypothetical protein
MCWGAIVGFVWTRSDRIGGQSTDNLQGQTLGALSHGEIKPDIPH